MIVGSQEWCDYWAAVHRKQADKWAARYERDHEEMQLTWMFLSMLDMHWWQDMEPWGKLDAKGNWVKISNAN